MNKIIKNTVPAKKIGANKQIDGLTVVLLAAGASKNDKFKYNRSLIRFPDNQTLIYKQIKTIYETFPLCELIVVVGFESANVIKEIQNYTNKVRIVENERYKDTGSFHSAKLGLRASNTQKILFINGDLYFNGSSIADMVSNKSTINVGKNKEFEDNEVGVVLVDNVITNLSYGLETKWGQMAFLTEKELNFLNRIAFDDTSHVICLFEALNKIIDMDGKFISYRNENQNIVEIDNPKDVKKLVDIK